MQQNEDLQHASAAYAIQISARLGRHQRIHRCEWHDVVLLIRLAL